MMRGISGKALVGVAALLWAQPALGQALSVVNSPHNLSASGTGSVRSTTEDQVCIFCHAPHNASPIRPLWNRATPVDAYTIYSSPALDAEPGQPTGSSKMCLSCHDGTIAIGAVFSRQTPIPMAGGVNTMPQGPGLIGTDLRDDHPISFRFDSSLAAADPKLRQPATLPHEIRLDANGELQCTTCHDAHNNVHGDFLVMSNNGSALCVSCHQMGATSVHEHRECASCHVSHGSPSGPYLLTHSTVGETCLSCHDGTDPHASNIRAQVSMPSNHETFSRVENTSDRRRNPQQSSCTDCHEPHTITHTEVQAPLVSGSLGAIDGVSSSGAPLQRAQNEYEVCFKCHAENSAVRPVVPRFANSTNTRLEFDPSAVSFHPVVAPGRNPDIPSLMPGLNTQNLIRCSDCHSQNTGAAGDMNARGVHGSPHRPLLNQRYATADYTNENPQAYALCYSCHNRNSILNDESFPMHRLHVVENRTSCAACHDAHGVSSLQGSRMNNTHLINFDTSAVLPNPDNGVLEFRDNGILAGTCTLRCHGVTHNQTAYP